MWRQNKPTDENPPITVGGRVQWTNAGKLIAALLAVLVPAITSAVSSYRLSQLETDQKVSEAKKQAAQAKNSSEAGYQVVKPKLESLEERVRRLEVAAQRAQKGPARKVLPVVVTPKPAPLPRDLNTAEAVVTKKVPPQPPPDGGP